MSKKPRLSGSPLTEAFDRYALQIGHIVYEWNHLQDILSGLFCTVVEAKIPDIPLAIWFSTKSDQAQRDMLRDAADHAITLYKLIKGNNEYVPPTKLDGLESVKWLVNQANTFAQKRNDAIHSPFSFVIGGQPVEVIARYRRGRAVNLRGKDL